MTIRTKFQSQLNFSNENDEKIQLQSKSGSESNDRPYSAGRSSMKAKGPITKNDIPSLTSLYFTSSSSTPQQRSSTSTSLRNPVLAALSRRSGSRVGRRITTLICFHCNTKFENEVMLYAHFLDEHNQIICPNTNCHEMFQTQQELQDHLLSHARSRPFVCSCKSINICMLY